MLCFAIAYLTFLVATACCIGSAIRHAPTDIELLGEETD